MSVIDLKSKATSYSFYSASYQNANNNKEREFDSEEQNKITQAGTRILWHKPTLATQQCLLLEPHLVHTQEAMVASMEHLSVHTSKGSQSNDVQIQFYRQNSKFFIIRVCPRVQRFGKWSYVFTSYSAQKWKWMKDFWFVWWRLISVKPQKSGSSDSM